MMEFGKRLSWRLTGGVVAIALGALAAAQAQRQGMLDATAHAGLEAPASADSLPLPIASDDGQSPVQPAVFAAMDPSTQPHDDAPARLVAQVNHEEPLDAPADRQHDESEQRDHDGPMALPPPAAFGPMGMMPAAHDSAAMQPDAAPGMSMPFMAMPGQPSSQPPAHEQAMPVPEMPMPEMHEPELPPDAMSMPEVQFDHAPTMNPGPINDGPMGDGPPNDAAYPNDGPSMSHGPSMSYGPSVNDGPSMNQGPLMAVGADGYEDGPEQSPLPSPPAQRHSPAMSGFANHDGQSPDASFGQNSLRDPSGMENQLRDAGRVDGPQQMPLPQLPAANAYQNDSALASMEAPARSHPATPAQFAGHQREAEPAGMGLSGRNADRLPAGGAGYGPDAYLGGEGQSISISSPGDRRLEGVQTPSVVIHKRAPSEVKVGRPATFVIHVKNVGSAEALGVLVHDRVPDGMQLVDAKPEPVMQGNLLAWQLGDMPVGDERSITLQLVPQEEGELGSVARVTFEAAASVRTRSTRPELKITQRAPQKVLIGQQLEIELEVANVGTGEATGVILQADVPPGLDHPRGRQLDNSLGSLRPGEVRREVLRMRAAEPGMIENVVHLVAEDAEPVTHSVSVEVIAPKLQVALNGPSRRFLERQATYMVNIANPGTAPATNVEIIARLDRGFTFVGTENDGHYDPNMHAVRWSIVDLPAGQSASVPVTLLPVEAGDQVIRLEANADLNSRSETESMVSVESQAELTFSIADTADPIELGSETTYEIKVRNVGSRNDTNVQVRMLLPAGLEMLESDSDAGTDGRGGVMFAPTKNLPAGGELSYRVRVRGVQPDTHVVKAVVTSDQSRVPVTKEESTMVYADQ